MVYFKYAITNVGLIPALITNIKLNFKNMLKVTHAEYTIYVPTKIGKERVFLDRISNAEIPYSSSNILTCSNGVEIIISSYDLRNLDRNIDEYITLLHTCTEGILEKKAKKVNK
jgi:hypothetical protein